MTPRVAIIIATYNHAAYLAEAIESALAQTVPCQVIVIDDGSTDLTHEVIDRYTGAEYRDRVECIVRPHEGICAARNTGLERFARAHRSEFVMFLDADDVIAPTKVERQIAEFERNPEVGWVLCDVAIEDAAKGTSETASTKYRYAAKELSGWIQATLEAANFIPNMAPLVRRSVLEDAGVLRIQFEDHALPEDWIFWHKVAGEARVAYIPEVLATYRHRRTGRSRGPKDPIRRGLGPSSALPLRLNLGCGTPDTRSWHPMPGLINLDKSLGWSFEDGLADYRDGSVSGITVSHALMYLPRLEWPRVFAEFARVLVPGGVIRITEDETADPRSSRHGGWRGSEPAVTLTTPEMVSHHLEAAGLSAFAVDRHWSHFRDTSLIQAQHGDPPDVFFMEGVKQTAVLFTPHADDETLFASFLVQKHRPRVVICFPSERDYGDTQARLQETRDAVAILGGGPVEQWIQETKGSVIAAMRALDARLHPTLVIAPTTDCSHTQHRIVAEAALEVFSDRLVTYHTYRDGQKVRDGAPIPFEPVWLERKLRALARYTSQIQHPRAQPFFTGDLLEYGGDRVTTIE